MPGSYLRRTSGTPSACKAARACEALSHCILGRRRIRPVRRPTDRPSGRVHFRHTPNPIPKPLGIMSLLVRPRRFRQPPHPGMQNSGFATSPFKKAAMSSSTGPQRNPITWTPDETSMASSGAEIAPQTRTPAPNPRNSLAREGRSVRLKLRSSRRTSRLFSKSMRSTLPATSNTGETRPSYCEIASFTLWRRAHGLPRFEVVADAGVRSNGGRSDSCKMPDRAMAWIANCNSVDYT